MSGRPEPDLSVELQDTRCDLGLGSCIGLTDHTGTRYLAVVFKQDNPKTERKENDMNEATKNESKAPYNPNQATAMSALEHVESLLDNLARRREALARKLLPVIRHNVLEVAIPRSVPLDGGEPDTRSTLHAFLDGLAIGLMREIVEVDALYDALDLPPEETDILDDGPDEMAG